MGHHRGDRASGLNQRDPRHATYCNRLVDPVLVSTSRNIFQSQKYFRGTFSVPKIFPRNISCYVVRQDLREFQQPHQSATPELSVQEPEPVENLAERPMTENELRANCPELFNERLRAKHFDTHTTLSLPPRIHLENYVQRILEHLVPNDFPLSKG